MPSEPQPAAAEIDELRQRLRALGYLDAGVDRFVLGAAHGGRGAMFVALLASVRIGLLAALLLGPAAALAVAVRLQGLVTGARDVIVLGLYMAILFGAATTIVALGAALLVAAGARRRGPALVSRARPLSIAAGVVVGALALAYLTLLWTSVSVGWSMGLGGAPAGGWPLLLAGFAAAAAAALLLGHAVTLTALAVIVAGAPSGLPRRGVPGSSWRMLLGTGALAFCAALTVFAATAPRPDASAPPALTVVPSGLRVRVIAIDGLDAAAIDRLAASGQAPALAETLAGGTPVTFDDLPGQPYDPARVWTTVATGQPPAVHGIESLEGTRVAGVAGRVGGQGTGWRTVRTALDLVRLTRPALASGTERRARTFWEVAAGAGLRTAVVNWWATWPAPADAGIVVSDRATLRLERGGPLDAEIAPAALYPALEAEWPGIRREAHEIATAALDGIAGGDAALPPQAARLDAATRLITARVTDPSIDLTVSYFAGPDIVGYGSQGSPAAGPTTYLVALDRMLAPVLAADPGEILFVIAAPGRGRTAPGRIAVKGTSAAAAPGAALGTLDVAPTILYALGVPLSRELPGTAATFLFTPAFAGRYPPRFVAGYGRPGATRAVRSGAPLEQEMLDRLRSLGYVK
jgi:hypothetical protein